MDIVNKLTVLKMIVAQAAPAVGEGAGDQPQVSPFGSMLPMIVIFLAIMYFLMIRPQQKRERERNAMLSSLSKGDSVVTSGGICGTIVGLTDSSVVLRVDDNTTIEFVRGAVSQVTPREEGPKKSK